MFVCCCLNPWHLGGSSRTTPTHWAARSHESIVKLAKAIRKLQTHGLALKEYAIFFDWTALPQKVDGRERDAADQASFADALSCMQVWYTPTCSPPSSS